MYTYTDIYIRITSVLHMRGTHDYNAPPVHSRSAAPLLCFPEPAAIARSTTSWPLCRNPHKEAAAAAAAAAPQPAPRYAASKQGKASSSWHNRPLHGLARALSVWGKEAKCLHIVFTESSQCFTMSEKNVTWTNLGVADETFGAGARHHFCRVHRARHAPAHGSLSHQSACPVGFAKKTKFKTPNQL